MSWLASPLPVAMAMSIVVTALCNDENNFAKFRKMPLPGSHFTV